MKGACPPAGVMALARQLGEKLGGEDGGCRPIPVLEPIASNFFRLTRKGVWSPEVMAEMEAIWRSGE